MTYSYSRYSPEIKLSSADMLAISLAINDQFAVDFAAHKLPEPAEPDPEPELDSAAFSATELLAISTAISADYAPNADNNAEGLVLMPIDPLHLHAYWHVEAQPQPSAAAEASALRLRVYEQTAKSTGHPWFDVDVNTYQGQQNINLPAHNTPSQYHASLSLPTADKQLAPLASSNDIYVPQTASSYDLPSAADAPMLFAESPQTSTPIRHHASGLGITQAQ